MGGHFSDHRTIRDATRGMQLEDRLVGVRLEGDVRGSGQYVHRIQCSGISSSSSGWDHSLPNSAADVHILTAPYSVPTSSLMLQLEPSSGQPSVVHSLRSSLRGLNHGYAAVVGAGVFRRRLSASPRRCSENSLWTNSYTPSAYTRCSISGVPAPVKMITG